MTSSIVIIHKICPQYKFHLHNLKVKRKYTPLSTHIIYWKKGARSKVQSKVLKWIKKYVNIPRISIPFSDIFLIFKFLNPIILKILQWLAFATLSFTFLYSKSIRCHKVPFHFQSIWRAPCMIFKYGIFLSTHFSYCALLPNA